MNGWTRDQMLAAIGIVALIIFSVGGYAVTISQPELRRVFWGDKSNTNDISVTEPTPAASPIPTQSSTPEQQSTPEPQPTAQPQPTPATESETRERNPLALYDGFDCTCPEVQEDVKELQSLLNEHGFSLEVDGLFGLETEAAVKEFQAQEGLEEDGIVGPETWAALLGD